MLYLFNKNYSIPNSLLINGKRVNLDLKKANTHEFEQICLYDVYNLKYLKRKLKYINTIVDIGANHGLFLIAARQHFKNAIIHCYEPNINLSKSLLFNARELDSKVYLEAVMKKDCMVNLHISESDLSTKTTASDGGIIPGISLSKLIQRSGPIDILKMDCEGAEWGLLEDTKPWEKIRALTMEYHLSKNNFDLDYLFRLLHQNNFETISHKKLTPEQGIIVAINGKTGLTSAKNEF